MAGPVPPSGAAMQNCPTAQWRMASELFQAAVERRVPPSISFIQRWMGIWLAVAPYKLAFQMG